MQRKGRVWLRIFPNIPVSKKPIEVRMGKGKGSPEYWVYRVKPGRIILKLMELMTLLPRSHLIEQLLNYQ